MCPLFYIAKKGTPFFIKVALVGNWRDNTQFCPGTTNFTLPKFYYPFFLFSESPVFYSFYLFFCCPRPVVAYIKKVGWAQRDFIQLTSSSFPFSFTFLLLSRQSLPGRSFGFRLVPAIGTGAAFLGFSLLFSSSSPPLSLPPLSPAPQGGQSKTDSTLRTLKQQATHATSSLFLSLQVDSWRLITQGGQSEADGTLNIIVIGYFQSLSVIPGGQSQADSTLSSILTHYLFSYLKVNSGRSIVP